MREELHHTKLPKAAWDLISEDQKSYIDEFTFYQLPNGHIAGHYAGECLAVWNGSGWEVYNSKTAASAKQAEKWMRDSMTEYEYGSSFDLAVECAYSLDLCEMCEVNGDKTFIPIWLTELAETILPDEEGK